MAQDPSDGSDKDRNAPTVRDLKGPGVSADTVPDIVGKYVPPRPLPEVSRHRTIDIKPVRLSAAADPRQARTERRLVSPVGRERGPSPLWLVGGLVTLLGLGAWIFVQEPSSPKTLAPKTRVASEATFARTVSRPVEPVPLRSAVPVPPPSQSAPVSNAESPPVPAATPKEQRPRETAKKRKDPWLE